MGVTVLQKRGHIFEDQFDSPALDGAWEIVPNDPARYSLSEIGSLRLLHGADPIYLFLSQLTGENTFVLDVKNMYNPVAAGDVGGLVVYADGTDNLRIEEYFDSEQGTVSSYPWLRLVRDYVRYSAYWSNDGMNWNLLGTKEFSLDLPGVGIFLTGDSGQFMDIDTVRAFRSPKVKVTGLFTGVKVELKDEAGATVDTKVCRQGDSAVSFDMSNKALPFTGRFVVTLADGEVMSSTELHEIWGGDEYAFSPSADLYFLNELGEEYHVDNNFEKFLGYINNGANPFREIKMIVRNNLTAGTVRDIVLKLVGHQGTDDYLNMVRMAADDGGVMGEYVMELSAGALAAGESYTFWIRIERPEAWLSRSAYFGIDMQSHYGA